MKKQYYIQPSVEVIELEEKKHVLLGVSQIDDPIDDPGVNWGDDEDDY